MGVHKVYVVVLGVIEHGVGSETVCDQVCFGMLCVRFVCVDMFEISFTCPVHLALWKRPF